MKENYESKGYFNTQFIKKIETSIEKLNILY